MKLVAENPDILPLLAEYLQRDEVGGQIILRLVITRDDIAKLQKGQTDCLKEVWFTNE